MAGYVAPPHLGDRRRGEQGAGWRPARRETQPGFALKMSWEVGQPVEWGYPGSISPTVAPEAGEVLRLWVKDLGRFPLAGLGLVLLERPAGERLEDDWMKALITATRGVRARLKILIMATRGIAVAAPRLVKRRSKL